MAPPAPPRKIFWVRVFCKSKDATKETAKLLREIKGVTDVKILKDRLLQIVMEGEAKVLEAEMTQRHKLVKVEREELAPPLPPRPAAAPPPPRFTVYKLTPCCDKEKCKKKVEKWVKSVRGRIQVREELSTNEMFVEWQGWVPPEKMKNWILASNIEVKAEQVVPAPPPPPKPEPKPESKPAQDKGGDRAITCLPESQLQGAYGCAPAPFGPSTLPEPFYYGFSDENVNACNVM